MFRILLSVILLLAKLQATAGDNLVEKDFGFSYSLKENGNGSVKYNIPEYSLQSFTADDGKVYKKPVMIDAGQVSDEGQPDLPSSSTFIAINPEKSYSINVNIISSNMTENIEILPKNSWDNNSEITFENEAFYNLQGHYPEKIAMISEPMTMRELSLVNLTVTPFRYYPQEKKLEEFTEIEIELIETGESDDIPFRPIKRSRAFEPLYESLLAESLADHSL